MRDRRDHGQDCEDQRPEGRPGEGRESREEGGRGDSQFLQLEISQVLFSEAEKVARPAFRELLLEAAKEQLRARFGDRIEALAKLAVDELLKEVDSSLEIEARIQRHQEERAPVRDRLREIFASASRRPEPGSPSERPGRKKRR